MHTVCRAKNLPMNAATLALLLASPPWLLSGCMTQSARDESTSPTRADSHITAPTSEVVVSPVPTEPNTPKGQLDLPKYDTQATVTKSKPVTKPKPAQPVATAATPPVKTPATLQDPEPTPEPASSISDQLAIAEPLPDMSTAEVTTAIQPADIMHLDLESLPLSFGEQWSLDRRLNPVTKKTQCILTSKAVNIPDGYETTDVQVLLTLDSIYVNADSHIDLKYPQTGIRIGEDALRPFDKLVKETTAIVSGNDVQTLYARMASSSDMVVSLGFWPTWPITETRSVSYALEDFRTAILALRACNRM